MVVAWILSPSQTRIGRSCLRYFYEGAKAECFSCRASGSVGRDWSRQVEFPNLAPGVPQDAACYEMLLVAGESRDYEGT
jgi:hypothetical protein